MSTTTSDRRVFRVPVALTIRAEVFLLADDLIAARDAARKFIHDDASTLTNHLNFDESRVWTEDPAILRFDDVDISVVDISGVAIDPHYPANKHPDFVPLPRR